MSESVVGFDLNRKPLKINVLLILYARTGKQMKASCNHVVYSPCGLQRKTGHFFYELTHSDFFPCKNTRGT